MRDSSDPSHPAGPADSADSGPVVPASVQIPEITPKAVVLSVVLAAALAGANAYLGLFAGMTVSASIPAAVVSMAVLRLFRESNILENNIVQTAASSGEALAAGVIFTVPALLLVGHWTTFDYWQTVALACVGGLLGVLCTIPLRRALIVKARLRFPEGVATAEVLKVGAGLFAASGQAGQGRERGSRGEEASSAQAGIRPLLWGALCGGAVKFGEAGLRLWTEAVEGAVRVGGSVFYAGSNLSPALLAVGFIVGLHTAVIVFLGGVLGWLVLLPIYATMVPLTLNLSDGSGVAAAKAIWSGHIRYVGIGAMLVGGIWTLLHLRGSIWESLTSLRQVYRGRRDDSRGGAAEIPFGTDPLRTERDAPFAWIVGSFVAALALMALLYYGAVGRVGVAAAMTLVMAVAAFLFSSVAGYMAGLVGSSSNPVSGVTIATILLSSLLLVALMGADHPAGPAAALLIGAIVCCAAAMGGDNLQDLKTGHLVGATPWKQQIMQLIGVGAGALVIVPVLALLQAKYGIGEVTAEHPHPLSAPQATLMASLTRGVFGGALPWGLVLVGGAIGAAIIVLDHRQAARGSAFRLPVLGVALGIYLPLKLSAAICAGGVLAALAERRHVKGAQGPVNAGLLCAAGLVTGEALTGILLAVPIALSGIWPSIGTDPFLLFETPPLGPWPGALAVAGVAWMLYRAGTTQR